MEPAGNPQPNDKQPNTAASSSPELDALTFEQAAEELERLVEDMENRVLPLEEMLAHYERGVKLAVQCGQKLSAAEKRIEIIKRLPDGAVTLAPLDAETTPELNPQAAGRTDDVEPATTQRPRPATRKAPAPSPSPQGAAGDDDDDELSLF